MFPCFAHGLGEVTLPRREERETRARAAATSPTGVVIKAPWKVYRKKGEGEWRWPVQWGLPSVRRPGSLAISMQMTGGVHGTGPSVSS